MPYSAPKKSVKEVRYLNKDFTSFKNNLINIMISTKHLQV